MKIPEEFNEIRPYEPEEMKQAFEDLLNDRQFNVIMKGFAPWLPKGIRNGLLRLAFKGVKKRLLIVFFRCKRIKGLHICCQFK